MTCPPIRGNRPENSQQQRNRLVQPGRGLTLATVAIELINSGNELMLARVLNTHQQWLTRAALSPCGLATVPSRR